MPHRVIIHAGFHKTGTSTLQNTLRANRVALKTHVALRLRWHMKDLVAATRGYSTWRDPLTLMKVQDRFYRLLDALPGMPRRTLILSSEELSGHLPGRGDLKDYSAASIILYALWEILHERFPNAQVLLYFSTRAPEPWLASAYWEHVKSSNMTLDFDAFRTRYHGAAALDDMVADIASRVPVPVHQHALEDCQALPLGPADPLLDLCDLPQELRAELIAAPGTNEHLGQDVLDALLQVNRTQHDPARRKAAKQSILSEARAI